MVGAGEGATVKSLLLVAMPPGVTTVILPEVAPFGTVAVICKSELTVKPKNDVATPLNRTAVAPVKFLPLMTTWAPTGALLGVTALMTGAGGVTTVKFV